MTKYANVSIDSYIELTLIYNKLAAKWAFSAFVATNACFALASQAKHPRVAPLCERGTVGIQLLRLKLSKVGKREYGFCWVQIIVHCRGVTVVSAQQL